MEADDQYWGRPETMTYERRAFLVSAETPGSDVASEMAAAMAISSLVFRGKVESSLKLKLIMVKPMLYINCHEETRSNRICHY